VQWSQRDILVVAPVLPFDDLQQGVGIVVDIPRIAVVVFVGQSSEPVAARFMYHDIPEPGELAGPAA